MKRFMNPRNTTIWIERIPHDYIQKMNEKIRNERTYQRKDNLIQITKSIVKLQIAGKMTAVILDGLLAKEIKPNEIRKTALKLMQSKDISIDKYNNFMIGFEDTCEEYNELHDSRWDQFGNMKKSIEKFNNLSILLISQNLLTKKWPKIEKYGSINLDNINLTRFKTKMIFTPRTFSLGLHDKINLFIDFTKIDMPDKIIRRIYKLQNSNLYSKGLRFKRECSKCRMCKKSFHKFLGCKDYGVLICYFCMEQYQKDISNKPHADAIEIYRNDFQDFMEAMKSFDDLSAGIETNTASVEKAETIATSQSNEEEYPNFLDQVERNTLCEIYEDHPSIQKSDEDEEDKQNTSEDENGSECNIPKRELKSKDKSLPSTRTPKRKKIPNSDTKRYRKIIKKEK